MTPNGARKLVVYGVVDGHLVKIGQVIWPHTAAGHDIAWRQIATMCLDHPTTLIDIKVLEDVTVGYGHELAARIAQGAPHTMTACHTPPVFGCDGCRTFALRGTWTHGPRRVVTVETDDGTRSGSVDLVLRVPDGATEIDVELHHAATIVAAVRAEFGATADYVAVELGPELPEPTVVDDVGGGLW